MAGVIGAVAILAIVVIIANDNEGGGQAFGSQVEVPDGDPATISIPPFADPAGVAAFVAGEGAPLMAFIRVTDPVLRSPDQATCSRVFTRLETMTPVFDLVGLAEGLGEEHASAIRNDLAVMGQLLDECATNRLPDDRVAEATFYRTIARRILQQARTST